jgi:mevalonate kinase
MNKIKVSAPGKLMLSGSYAVVNGFPCLSTAVDQRLLLEVQKIENKILQLAIPDLGLDEYIREHQDLGNKDVVKAARFVEQVYKIFLNKYPQEGGVKVLSKCSFSESFGFGSSSAVSVALAKALSELYGVKLSNKELFDLCYEAVLAVQGVGSGFDIATAIWGGTIYYVSPAKVVKPLPVKNLPIVVGFTGVKASTPPLVKSIQKRRSEQPELIEGWFREIGEIVEEMSVVINKKDWLKVGELLNQHQEVMRKLEVSSTELENLIEAALKAGAYGAGLSGAGGGDCMLAVVDEENRDRVEKAIISAGGEIMNVKLNSDGIKLER